MTPTKQESKNLIAWAFIISFLVYPIIISIISYISGDLDLKGVIIKFQDSLQQIVLLIVYDYYKTKNVNENSETHEHNKSQNANNNSTNNKEYSNISSSSEGRRSNIGEAVFGEVRDWGSVLQ